MTKLVVLGAFVVFAATFGACAGEIQLGVPPDEATTTGADAGTDGLPAESGSAGSSTPYGTCTTDTDCLLATLHCDARGVCVECRTSADCTVSDRTRCEASRCVGCVSDADCEPTKRCSLTRRRCVDRCSAERPCELGTCDIATGACAECSPGGTCEATSERRVCSSRAECIECLTDANCAADNDEPHCDVAFGRCVKCTANTHCTNGTRCDPSSGECRSN